MGFTNENHHHQATDGLLKLLTKANHDLTLVQHRLDKEFQQIYPDNANPMNLVSRIKKLQEDLSDLKDHCREILSAKQDLIDKARTILAGNRSALQRMQISIGGEITSDDSGDYAFDCFNQVIDEWTLAVRSATGDESNGSNPEDVNKLLFSAIVQSN